MMNQERPAALVESTRRAEFKVNTTHYRRHLRRESAHLTEEAHRTGAEEPQGLQQLVDTAKINLESAGRALLDLRERMDLAVEYLERSGALSKPEVRRQLLECMSRLERSDRDEDQGALIEISKRLLAINLESFTEAKDA